MSGKRITLEEVHERVATIRERVWGHSIPEMEELEDEDYYEDEEDKEYLVNSYTDDISFIEFAIINGFLHDSYIKKKNKEIKVKTYGTVDNIGRLEFGGGFDVTSSYWFGVELEN